MPFKRLTWYYAGRIQKISLNVLQNDDYLNSCEVKGSIGGEHLTEYMVFLSYAHEDITIAYDLYRTLSQEGISVWFDKTCLLPGENWEYIIERRIKNYQFFIALLSSKYLVKKGYVHKELRKAFDELDKLPETSIFIIPVCIDKCEPSKFHPKLQKIHQVNLFQSWDDGIRKILRVIRENLPQKYNPINESDEVEASQYTFCSKCGSQNNRKATFCGGCKSVLNIKGNNIFNNSHGKQKLGLIYGAAIGILILSFCLIMIYNLLPKDGTDISIPTFSTTHSSKQRVKGDILFKENDGTGDIPTPTSFSTPHSSEQWVEGKTLLKENFENGITNQWFFNDGFWVVIKDDMGNCVLKGEATDGYPLAETGRYLWHNYAFEMKARLVKLGTAPYGEAYNLIFRASGDCERYVWNVNQTAINLGRQEQPYCSWRQIQLRNYQVSVNSWTTFRVEVTDNIIRGYINGLKEIEAIDNQPLLEGRIGFTIPSNSEVWFDDIRVVELVSK